MPVDPFPERPQANVFSPVDIAAVRRWAVPAAHYRCFLLEDDEGRIVRADENGRESIAVALGDTTLEPSRLVAPRGDYWIVADTTGGILGIYETLDAALQSIQPTNGWVGTA